MQVHARFIASLDADQKAARSGNVQGLDKKRSIQVAGASVPFLGQGVQGLIHTVEGFDENLLTGGKAQPNMARGPRSKESVSAGE
jgi:hypothetical protein